MDAKTHIYLIRHGEKKLDGSALSARGKKQSELFAKKFRKTKFNKIYSSPLERCKQTAEIISKPHSQKIFYDERLEEVEGEVKEFPEKHKKEISKIKTFFEEASNISGNVLVVGSGNINRVLIGIALNINPRNSRFVQIPTGLTKMDVFDNGVTRMECVDDTSHLPESLRKRQEY